jgi:hypothetical protein
MAPLTKMCLINPSIMCQEMALGRVPRTCQTRDFLPVCGSETNRIPPLYLLIQSAKLASLHTQTTKGPERKRSFNGIVALISKIWAQSAFELDLSLRCLVLDAVPGARARTGVRHARPERMSEPRPRPCSPAPIKPPRARLTSPSAHLHRPAPSP